MKLSQPSSIIQSFILLLRRFKANDEVVEEIYDNLQDLADAINEIDTGGSSITLGFDPTTNHIKLITSGKDIGYDNVTKRITISNESTQISGNES